MAEQAPNPKRAPADLMRLILALVAALLAIWFFLLFWK
jgi:hypothetical protein